MLGAWVDVLDVLDALSGIVSGPHFLFKNPAQLSWVETNDCS